MKCLLFNRYYFSWFDAYLLVLRDKDHGVNIHTFSQAIPVPVEKLIDKEVADIDLEHKLSEYLKVSLTCHLKAALNRCILGCTLLARGSIWIN